VPLENNAQSWIRRNQSNALKQDTQVMLHACRTNDRVKIEHRCQLASAHGFSIRGPVLQERGLGGLIVGRSSGRATRQVAEEHCFKARVLPDDPDVIGLRERSCLNCARRRKQELVRIQQYKLVCERASGFLEML
jgi:hypothetical protein